MITQILYKYGKKKATLLLGLICVVASVLISIIFWNLVGKPNSLGELLIIATICPTIIAPPIIYSYNCLAEKLKDNRRELARLNVTLNVALDEVKELTGFLPICAHCKKIRDDEGGWEQIESYIKRHSNANFTHSICPECVTEYRKDISSPELKE